MIKKCKRRGICRFCKKWFVINNNHRKYCSKKCRITAIKIKWANVKRDKSGEYQKYKERINLYCKDYRKKNPEKIRAQNKVNKSHIPLKDFCEGCGSKRNLCKHHLDYSKPLEIVFLCRRCHAKIHNRSKWQTYQQQTR